MPLRIGSWICMRRLLETSQRHCCDSTTHRWVWVGLSIHNSIDYPFALISEGQEWVDSLADVLTREELLELKKEGGSFLRFVHECLRREGRLQDDYVAIRQPLHRHLRLST